MCPGPWASPHVWGCSRLGAVVWHPCVRGPEVGPEISTWTWRCEAPRALWVPSKSWRCRSQLSHRCGAARVISLSAPASLECSPLLFEPWLLVQLELWSPGTAVLASGQTWRWHVPWVTKGTQSAGEEVGLGLGKSLRTTLLFTDRDPQGPGCLAC